MLKHYWIKNASEIQNVIGNNYKEKRKSHLCKNTVKKQVMHWLLK